MCVCVCVQLGFSQKEEELQRGIDELRINLAQIAQSLKMRERTVSENREKVVAIGRKLASLGSGGSALEGLQKELTSTVGHSMNALNGQGLTPSCVGT